MITLHLLVGRDFGFTTKKVISPFKQFKVKFVMVLSPMLGKVKHFLILRVFKKNSGY